MAVIARTLAGLVLASSVLGASAAAQGTPSVDSRSWLASASHYGKWVAIASAAGLMTVAIMRNHDADRVYGGLQTLCQAGGATCVIDLDGHYLNPDAEALYQETLRIDSQSRSWMAGGQVMLAAAGAMFVIDLVAGNRKPKNIPFTPLEYFADGTRAGLTLRF